MTIVPSPTQSDNHADGVMPSWLTYTQSTVYANLSRCTLWRAIDSGELEAAKVGRAVRISRTSLDDFMRSRCR